MEYKAKPIIASLSIGLVVVSQAALLHNPPLEEYVRNHATRLPETQHRQLVSHAVTGISDSSVISGTASVSSSSILDIANS